MKVTSTGNMVVIPPPPLSMLRGNSAKGINGYSTNVFIQMEVLARPESIRKPKPGRKKKK